MLTHCNSLAVVYFRSPVYVGGRSPIALIALVSKTVVRRVLTGKAAFVRTVYGETANSDNQVRWCYCAGGSPDWRTESVKCIYIAYGYTRAVRYSTALRSRTPYMLLAGYRSGLAGRISRST